MTPEPESPSSHSDDLARERHSYRIFFLSVSLAVALCITGVFLGMALQQRNLVESQLLNRARTDFASLVLMRQWNAGYGGVYVIKRPGMVANPYLPNPDLHATDGRVLTKKNPSLMTRELSQMLRDNDAYAFHLTSLNPLNPDNRADAAESAALRAFAGGESERFWYEELAGSRYFRYMAPLKVETSCLECHAAQGYALGDIRGGISIRFNIAAADGEQRANQLLIMTLALLTGAVLLGSIYVFFRRLVHQLDNVHALLKTQAISEPLTGLYNRRYLLERFALEVARSHRSNQPLCCLMFDLDHFKTVNDRFGHLVGDEVLRMVARILRDALRPYDIIGRFGGEEFLVVAPTTTPAEATAIAERLRRLIEQTPVTGGSAVTISVGVAALHAGDSLDQLIHRADQALYRAKDLGRNRVETLL